nr:MAG TPA: hypothetical protein [Caudoviricetes sp.]
MWLRVFLWVFSRLQNLRGLKRLTTSHLPAET